MYAIDSPAANSCIRDHSNRVYFRVDPECMAGAKYVGLQQYAGNILGQICPEFTLLWFFLSAIGIFLDDLIRWLLFGEEKPHYHLFRKRKGDK